MSKELRAHLKVDGEVEPSPYSVVPLVEFDPSVDIYAAASRNRPPITTETSTWPRWRQRDARGIRQRFTASCVVPGPDTQPAMTRAHPEPADHLAGANRSAFAGGPQLFSRGMRATQLPRETVGRRCAQDRATLPTVAGAELGISGPARLGAARHDRGRLGRVLAWRT